MNKPLVLIVLVVALALTVNQCKAQNSTTCVFQAGAYTSYDSVLQCFYSIPFDPVVRSQTIDALKKAVELYAFLDIANDSPDPNLPMKVNILGGLDAISKRPYKYDYEFQDDLRALFVQLNDAHTQYYTPLCYRALSVAQPIGPVSYVSNGQQVVAVSPFFDPNLVSYYQQNYNINVTSFEGAIITAIDGQPALQYFLTYANHSMGMCKDLGTRLNYAMTIVKPLPNLPGAASPGYWQNRTKRNPLPRQPIVDYTFQMTDGSTVNVSIPWVASSINTYTGVSSFLKDYWATSTPLPTKHQIKRKLASPSIDREPRPSLQRVKVPESVAASGNTYTLLASSPDLWFWQLSDNKTLVMYLDTMAPTNYVATFAALNRGFNAAAENNLTQLIIDLTDNGGGSICFGQTLLAYLQGELPESQNWGPQDLPCSPLQTNLTLSAVARNVEDTVWSPAFYANQQDVHIANNDTSYLIPGLPHIRGGKQRNYTRLVHINNCGEFGYRIKPAKYFKPQEIMIVTHGFCGSTCALFANHLNLYDNVTAIVVGGIQGHVQQYTSFPGLQVLDSPDLYAQFAELGQQIAVGNAQPGELCPRRLPTTGAYRMCIREIYPPVPKYSTKPIEFTFQQAEFHLDNSYQTATAPENIWYQVVGMFPSAKRE